MVESGGCWCLGLDLGAGFEAFGWGTRESHCERREGVNMVGFVGLWDFGSAEFVIGGSVESCEFSGGWPGSR